MALIERRFIRAFAIAGWVGFALHSQDASGQTPGQVVLPDNVRTLEGRPTIRLDATQDGVKRRRLDSAEAAAQGLKISFADGRYFWTSRDNQPLTMSSAGEFVYLSSQPGRYVRFRKVRDKILYVEHVDMDFGSVTYWGELRFELGK